MDRLMVTVSGVRGTVGGTLNPQIGCQFGCAMGAMLGPGKRVVMGRDTRPSGPMLRCAVASGLMASGVSVIDLGVVTTPGVALMTRKLKADGGIILTASHNPFEYNGIKFLQPSGPGLTFAQAARLKQIWETGQFAMQTSACQGTETRDTTTHDAHCEAVLAVTDVNAVAAKRFKVVLDSINGAGCVVTPTLLGKLGCEVAHLNGEATGQFAHAPEPIKENLGGLCDAVRKHRAAVGFAQDPDADRLVIVDENGTFIGEECTLALATAYALRKRKGTVATNLVTSRMIDDIAAAAGCRVVHAPTGEANVVEAMEREGAIFGGEGNGGVIDPRVVPVRDSLVGMSMILQYMTVTGSKLSELVAQLPKYVMLKTKFPCPAGVAGAVAAASKAAFAARAGVQFNESDGLRIDVPEGWVCVRASNTEPIMRIIAEARDEKTVQAMVAEVRAIADKVIGKHK